MTENTDADRETSGEPDEAAAPDDPMLDAEKVIAAFGGVRPMASRLGIAATTIQGWKSRGNIPDNRQQSVREAAEADGIDLAGLQQDAASADETPPDEEQSGEAAPTIVPASAPVAERPQSASGGPAWAALIIAVIVGIAVLTQPQWSPFLYGSPQAEVPEALVGRITALESRPKVPDLTQRVAAAERGLNDLQTRDPGTPGPDLTPQLRDLATRVDALTQALDKARLDGRVADDSRAADVSALQSAVEALSAKLDQAVVDTAQTSARKSSVIVAVGALEVALGDGLPYGHALDSVERLAETDDAAFAKSLATLKAHAAGGVPTRSQLASRLDQLIAARGKPLWKADTDSWTDRVLRKVDAVIAVRRIDDGAGPVDRLRRARKALGANDLKGAAGALKDAAGAGGDWARDAQRRIDADQALSTLRLWALKALEAPANEKSSAQ